MRDALAMAAFLGGVLLIMVLIGGCSMRDPCVNDAAPPAENYTFHQNMTTPDGWRVDSDYPDLDLDLIDSRIRLTRECLNQVDWDQVSGAFCLTTVEYPVVSCEDCLKVKVTSDWTWSEDHEYQLLNEPLPKSHPACAAKGFSNCRWRAGVLDPGVVVVPQDMRLFEDTIIQYLTGCYNPWGDEQLHACTWAAYNNLEWDHE